MVGGDVEELAKVTATATAARSSGVQAATSAAKSPDSASDANTAAMSPADKGKDEVGVVAMASNGREQQRNRAHGELQVAADRRRMLILTCRHVLHNTNSMSIIIVNYARKTLL